MVNCGRRENKLARGYGDAVLDNKLLEVLRRLFSTHGLIVADNRPQLAYKELSDYCRYRGVTSTLMPSYHFNSNGTQC